MTQTEALTLLKMGKNVFLTGAAGAGKTYVLNSYIEFLKKHKVETAITASTGIAATHIGGMTIHSWSGLGIKDSLSDRDLDQMEQQQYLWKRFETVQVLIIDEISMLKDSMLDMINIVCKTFKRNNLPFGGLQVVLCGDFFQLPPIEKTPLRPTRSQETLHVEGSEMSYAFEEEYEMRTPFAFLAQSWKEASFQICYLQEQYRQEDGELLNILNEIRNGDVSDDTVEKLQERIVTVVADDTPKLYTHNADVDAFNLEMLSKIEGKEVVFDMVSKGKPGLVEALKKGCLSPSRLRTRVGALVMFVKNNPTTGYVNGTIGTITGYEAGYPVVETKEGKKYTASPQSWSVEEQGGVLAEVAQVPLKLAWAVTIHKSQGMTLDSAYIDLSRAFVPGQGYVALSRVRNLDGLQLKGLNRQALEIYPQVLNYDQHLRKLSESSSRRLAMTDARRIEECCEEFLAKAGSSSEKPAKKKSSEKTRDAIKEKTPLMDIASDRGIAKATVIDHIQKLLDDEEISVEDIQYLRPKKVADRKRIEEIVNAFGTLDTRQLKPVADHFSGKYDYEIIKFARLFCEAA